MFNYFVIKRVTGESSPRETVQVRTFTKKMAIEKVFKTALLQGEDAQNLEFAAFKTKEYLSLRHDDLLNPDRFVQVNI